MKKLTLCIATVLLLFTLIPIHLNATDTDPVIKASTETVASAEADVLLARLDAINKMDKSTLSPSERKELRKEVRDIKSTLLVTGGGVYISVGVLILVVLLLILLL